MMDNNSKLPKILAIVGTSLVWLTLRARRYLKLIAGSLSLAIVALFSGQVLAVVTGLASGETPTGGWEWALVLRSIVIYTLLLVILGVGCGWCGSCKSASGCLGCEEAG